MPRTWMTLEPVASDVGVAVEDFCENRDCTLEEFLVSALALFRHSSCKVIPREDDPAF